MRFSITLCFLLLTSLAFSQSIYKVNPKVSRCSWKGSAAVGLYSIEGSLEIDSGKLVLEDEKINQAELVVDMKTLETSNKSARKHLRGVDFFDVKTYPLASFVLESPLLFSEGSGVAIGMIEIKGMQKEIKVPMIASRDKGQIILEGSLLLDRTDFGITYNSPNFFENLGDQAVSDEIEFTFRLVFEDEL